jgi:hypothetical protein
MSKVSRPGVGRPTVGRPTVGRPRKEDKIVKVPKYKRPNSGPRITDGINDGEQRSHGSYKYLDIYPDLWSMESRGASQEFIDRLGQDLLAWAKNSDSLLLNDFFTERFISTHTYRRWSDRDKMFSDRLEMAKLMIGSRREKGALQRKFDASVMIKSAPLYDPEWKLLEEWRAKLAKVEEENEQLRVLIETIKPEEKLIEDSKPSLQSLGASKESL